MRGKGVEVAQAIADIKTILTGWGVFDTFQGVIMASITLALVSLALRVFGGNAGNK